MIKFLEGDINETFYTICDQPNSLVLENVCHSFNKDIKMFHLLEIKLIELANLFV